jgi:uncharacterized protein DUF6069
MTTTLDELGRPAATLRSVRRARALTGVAAAGASTALWLAAHLLDVPLTVTLQGQSPMKIGIGVVLATALTASLAGWGSLALLERLTTRARTIWTALATLALIASLAAPAFADASASTRTTLVLMHVTVAAVLIPGLRRTPRS